MSKVKLLWGAALLVLAASCAQEDVVLEQTQASNEIAYKVDAGKMSRAASAYMNGTDVSKITVSAWLKGTKETVPAFTSPERFNSSYFLNDVLDRSGKNGNKGTFNYSEGMRYWPANGEYLDFYAVVDNEAWIAKNGDSENDNNSAATEDIGDAVDEEGTNSTDKKDKTEKEPIDGSFSFDNGSGAPGLGWINQLGLADMPDLLFSTTVDQTLTKTTGQQNVSFSFDHAFAQVIVTAEVQNKNLRVVITDLEICGVAEKGRFTFAHKSDAGNVDAKWEPGEGRTEIKGLLKGGDVILDMAETSKATLLNNVNKEDRLLVIPLKYGDYAKPGNVRPHIRLKGYAYNIANPEAGFDEDTDFLIFSKPVKDSKPLSSNINIPIDFNWKPGTINTYNIIFKSGNGGTTNDPEYPVYPDPDDPENPDPNPDPTNPDTPAFIQVSYEVNVEKWEEGEKKPDLEYDKIK